MRSMIVILLFVIFIFGNLIVLTTIDHHKLNLEKFKETNRGFFEKNKLFKKYLEFIIYYRKVDDSVKKSFINNFFPSYFLKKILSESLEFEGLVI